MNSILNVYKKQNIFTPSSFILKSFKDDNFIKNKKHSLPTEEQKQEQENIQFDKGEYYKLDLGGGEYIEKNKKYKVGERLREKILKETKKQPTPQYKKRKTVDDDKIISNLSRSMTQLLKE